NGWHLETTRQGVAHPRTGGETGTQKHGIATQRCPTERRHPTMPRTRRITDTYGHVLIQDPPIARLLFQSTGLMAIVWLLARLFIGYQWIESGWEKLRDPAWMAATGEGILSYWQRAVAIPA